MATDHDSGEYIRPAKQYLDDLLVWDPALGETELWKSIAYNTAVLRNKMQHRADSAGAITAAAAAKASEAQPKAPPLVADAASKAKADEAAKMKQVLTGLDALERRLDVLETRKCQQAEDAARAEIAEQALLLAEQIAEETPGAVMDALSPTPKPRLH